MPADQKLVSGVKGPCPHCAKESQMLREQGVTDEKILSVPLRGQCGHEPEVSRRTIELEAEIRRLQSKADEIIRAQVKAGEAAAYDRGFTDGQWAERKRRERENAD